MSHILDLVARAGKAGLHVSVTEPAPNLPDTESLLGIPLDFELAMLLRTSNGCQIGSMTIYGAQGTPYGPSGWYNLVRINVEMRNDISLHPNMLIFAGFGYQATNLATVPIYIDKDGRQPIVIVDTNEEPFILPLASTLDRALSLVVSNDIRTAQDPNWLDEPFPENLADRIAQDTRLMELIDADVFTEIDGGTEDLQEWCELLRGFAPR